MLIQIQLFSLNRQQKFPPFFCWNTINLTPAKKSSFNKIYLAGILNKRVIAKNWAQQNNSYTFYKVYRCVQTSQVSNLFKILNKL